MNFTQKKLYLSIKFALFFFGISLFMFSFANAQEHNIQSNVMKNDVMQTKKTNNQIEQENNTQALFLKNETLFFTAKQDLEKNTWYLSESGVEYLLLEAVIEKEKIQNTHMDQNIYESSSLTENSTHSTIQIYIDVLKFSPKNFSFNVYSASKQGQSAKTIATWHQQENLVSAINASMFLQDNLTSNGYLRCKDHINNGRIASRLGGFFVAQPKKDLLKNFPEEKKNEKLQQEEKSLGSVFESATIDLPNAAIIYKDDIDFSRFTHKKEVSFTDILDMYDIVIQNFKLFEASDSVSSSFFKEADQWASDKRHSIAAIAEDKDGNILFLFVENSISIKEFVKIIRHDPFLNLTRALYLDGGKHAGMTLSFNDTIQNWFSNDSLLLMFLGQVPLPNIIGVHKK